jgi:peroxiredoxin
MTRSNQQPTTNFPASRETALTAGTPAPDFTLTSSLNTPVALSDFRGQPVIIAFYPADWSPTCGDQLALYNEILPEFERFGAQLLGISVDGKWSHKAYAESRNLRFPILSDFEPKGAVARLYGVYNSDFGLADRSLFVIDAEGIIRWNFVPERGINPGADGILRALETLPAPVGARS